jgi:hypothetical protein
MWFSRAVTLVSSTWWGSTMPLRWACILILDRINVDAARFDVEHESSYMPSLSLLQILLRSLKEIFCKRGMWLQEWKRRSAQPIHKFGRFVSIAGHGKSQMKLCGRVEHCIYAMPVDPVIYTALVQWNFKNPVTSNRCQRNPERLQIHTKDHTRFQSHHRIFKTCMFPTQGLPKPTVLLKGRSIRHFHPNVWMLTSMRRFKCHETRVNKGPARMFILPKLLKWEMLQNSIFLKAAQLF